MHLAVQAAFTAPGLLQGVDDQLHVLRLRAVGHPQRAGHDAEFAQRVEHHEAVFFVADAAGRRHVNVVAGQVHQPLRCLLEQGLIAREREQLLGVQRPAERPLTGAAATGHDDRRTCRAMVQSRVGGCAASSSRKAAISA